MKLSVNKIIYHLSKSWDVTKCVTISYLHDVWKEIYFRLAMILSVIHLLRFSLNFAILTSAVTASIFTRRESSQQNISTWTLRLELNINFSNVNCIISLIQKSILWRAGKCYRNNYWNMSFVLHVYKQRFHFFSKLWTSEYHAILYSHFLKGME